MHYELRVDLWKGVFGRHAQLIFWNNSISSSRSPSRGLVGLDARRPKAPFEPPSCPRISA
jgi:hypothetical protein